MKFLLIICLATLVWSCGDTTQKTTSVKGPEVQENWDTRTKAELERDSIRIMNSITILNVVKKASTIDSKKLDGSPFNTMDFDKVVAYSYDGSHEQIKIAPGIGKTRSASETIDQQVGINQKQANIILSLFGDKSTYDPMASAGCFEPRFALVLYKDNSSVMQISVCLDCNNVHFTPEIKANEGGLSKKGRKTIIAFCKELKFPYGELKN